MIERILNGERFKFDFKNRTLKIGNENIEVVSQLTTFEDIENAFEEYLYSRPSERSGRIRRTYFKAKTADELTDEQLICGGNREVARFKLEYAVMSAIINGLPWGGGSWYWKSNRFPELILLKEWW